MTKKSSFSHMSNLTALDQARQSEKAPPTKKSKVDPKKAAFAEYSNQNSANGTLPMGRDRCPTNITEEEASPGRAETAEKKSVVNPLLASVQTHGSLKAIQEAHMNQLGSRSSGMSMDSG